eukprot:6187396-Pleurochrysis_carterae.AAC.2
MQLLLHPPAAKATGARGGAGTRVLSEEEIEEIDADIDRRNASRSVAHEAAARTGVDEMEVEARERERAAVARNRAPLPAATRKKPSAPHVDPAPHVEPAPYDEDIDERELFADESDGGEACDAPVRNLTRLRESFLGHGVSKHLQ